MGADEDNRALPGVYVAVVMGRHAGFLTAASALARNHANDGPHLIYLPEREFVVDQFLASVKAVHTRLGRCVIAVSEGIHDKTGQPIISQLSKTVEKDAHGNVQLSGTGALADLLADTIKDKLGIKRVRADTFGYLQRSFAGIVSDVDAREAREVGKRALIHAVEGDSDGSVTIKRVGAGDYKADFAVVPLTAVAAKTKVMADNLIAASGTDITPDFVTYLKPLLGSNMPVRGRIAAAAVGKLLK
jgi:6-phosphofructokinase 1